MKTANAILTLTLSTGETVLAKSSTEPLRYGNQMAAQKKIDSLSPILAQNEKSASVMGKDGRFLVLVYDRPVPFIDPDAVIMYKRIQEQQSIPFKFTGGGSGLDYMFQAMDNTTKATPAIKIYPFTPSRPPFATVSGVRQNPRSRHNHNHKDQTDKPYHFWS